jgi:3-dehydroquinate synthase
MKKLKISADRKYEIFVDTDFYDALGSITNKHQQVLLVVPSKLAKLIKIKKLGNLKVLTVPDGENQKNFVTLQRIWAELGKGKFSRSDAIIGLGGGATTDLAGYAAASWLRGISWYAIPTSLAAMVDASIGGKTAINSPVGKNLIGAFYSPSAVYIDLNFLKTLPKRDISAGMAEVIKCGFIADKKILELAQKDVLDFKELIYRSVKVKVKVVNKDFKESKLREVLNYGHTLGHAIEKHSKFKLRHGEAVSIGLVFAAELSNLVGTLSLKEVNDHRDILKSFNLPTTYSKSALPSLIKLMLSDKKVKNQRIRFIGLSKIGKPQWFEAVNTKQIKMAYERIGK